MQMLNDWLDISTAPKDGTAILLAKVDLVSVGEWSVQESYTQEYRDEDGNYMGQYDFDGFEGWMDREGGLQDWTHWQPMPAPPEPPTPARDDRTADMFEEPK